MGRHVCKQFTGIRVFHLGTRRHAKNNIIAVLAMFTGALAVVAAFGLVMAPKGEVDERAEVRIDLQHNTTTVTSVTAIGTSGGHILLSPKADHSVTAVPGLEPKTRPIVEVGAHKCHLLQELDYIMPGKNKDTKKPDACTPGFFHALSATLYQSRLRVHTDLLVSLAHPLVLNDTLYLGE